MRIFVVEVASGMELIGGEDAFGGKLKHVGDNSCVSILLGYIGTHQECKTIRTNTESICIDRVCHTKYLV